MMRSASASLARRLAEQALTFDSPLPPEVSARLKICFLDFLSGAYETLDRGLPWAEQALAVTRPAGGALTANVVGTSLIATPGDAAFVNSVLGHGLVREDMHPASIGHHGIVVWPVLLALAQARPTGGRDFLSAAVVGYEGAGRIGSALFDADLARLFRPTSLIAPLGAVLAGSRILGLSADAATSAFSLAANALAGLNQWPHRGGSEMYFEPGFAARNAITALELAEQGAFASPDILEGEAGVFAAFKRARAPSRIELFADGRFEVLDVFSKPAPACNFAQTACQAAAAIAARNGPSRAIESVSVRVTEAAVRYPGCDYAGPFERTLQAKMSIQFGVAAALVRGTISEENYADLADPEIIRLVGRTTLAASDAFTAAFPAKQGSEVEIRLTDGSTDRQRLENLVPASDAEVRRRFRDSAAALLGPDQPRQVEDLVDGLEDEPDAGRLGRLCARGTHDPVAVRRLVSR